MTQLLIVPPPPEVLSAMLAIPRVRVEPATLTTQQGPEGGLGPESAGAILILQATFASAAGAQSFWEAAVPLTELLASAPGFIRRYSFFDGPSVTLIALWRTAADAKAYAATPQHRAAVRDLYRQRWQYSHFSAIWEMTSNYGRLVFCDRCDQITAVSERVCAGCGAPLLDAYQQETPALTKDPIVG
jgi:heme-degrading monooxygenase HmoA